MGVEVVSASAGSLTVKERILLHLFDYTRYAEEYVAPLAVTQEGIARAAGIRVHHVSQYVKPLISDEAVEESSRHVEGRARRRKVYFLTPKGRLQSASLRDVLLRQSLPFRNRSGEIMELSLSEIYQDHRRGSHILELLEEQRSKGYVAEEVETAKPSLVDYTEEAPEVESFYGREEDLLQVLDGLGSFSTVVVTGMAGIGKTTLGSKVCDELRGERSLFWRQIRGFDTAMALALRLANFLKDHGRTGLHGYLLGSGRKELSRIEELLASDLAGLPVLFVLDDVHKASQDAAAFASILHEAGKAHADSALLLLSRTAPDFYSRREVEVEAAVVEVPLGSLDAESSHAILTKAGVTAPLLGTLVHACGGNPLFLKLAAKAGTLGIPSASLSTLETYIAEEIEPSLEKVDRGCLEIASLYHVPMPSQGLMLERGVRKRTLIALHRKGLLDRLHPDRYVLHDSLRSYFSGSIPAHRLEEIVPKVVERLLGEARRQADRGSPGEAIPFLGNAVEIDDDPKRLFTSLELLARVRRFAGDFDGAIEALRTALGIAPKLQAEAKLHGEVARCLLLRGDLDEAEAEVKLGLEKLPLQPSLERAWLLHYSASIALRKQAFDEALREIEEVREWLPALPQDLDLLGSLANTWGLVQLEDPNRFDLALAEESFQEAIEAWEAIGEKTGLCLALNNLALVANEMGRFERSQEHLDRCASLAKETGHLPLQLNAMFTRAAILTVSVGDYETAESLLNQTYRLAKDMHRRDTMVWHHYYFAEIHRNQGRLPEARESLDYFLRSSGDMLNEENRVAYRCLMARLCVRAGDAEAARANIEEAEALASALSSEFADHALHWANAELHASLGEREEAKSSYQRAVGMPIAIGRGELLLDYGSFLLSLGDRERGKDVLHEAQEETARISRPLERKAKEMIRSLETEVGT